MTERDTVEVLLVEDDPADVMMITEALRQSPLTIKLHVAGDGEQALHFLRRTHGFADAPGPSLVMLQCRLACCRVDPGSVFGLLGCLVRCMIAGRDGDWCRDRAGADGVRVAGRSRVAGAARRGR
jgi:CheY-like chemotaxis protein